MVVLSSGTQLRDDRKVKHIRHLKKHYLIFLKKITE